MTTRAEIIEEARSWIGTPFQHQGRIKGEGVDCIGLVYMVAKKFNLADTDMSTRKAQPYLGYSRVPSRGLMRRMCREYLVKIRFDEVLPGDIYLIKFKLHEGHVAIASGDNTIIHALSLVKKCTEHSLSKEFRQSITGAYRYPALCN